MLSLVSEFSDKKFAGNKDTKFNFFGIRLVYPHGLLVNYVHLQTEATMLLIVQNDSWDSLATYCILQNKKKTKCQSENVISISWIIYKPQCVCLEY